MSLVMQEPIIFNYSILENMLYGKLDASNSEIAHVSEISCCTEFIENKQIVKLDDSAQALVKEMEKNKGPLVELIG